MSRVTAELARQLFSYNRRTGILRWRVDRVAHLKSGNDIILARAGSVAGANHICGYRTVSVRNERFLVHRIAWLIVRGRWPANELDHVNGDKADNRFVNLREATKSQNGQNRGPQKNNRSGFKGVSWGTRDKKWVARIKIGKKYVSLGAFDTAIAAAAAYKVAAILHHGPFARTE